MGQFTKSLLCSAAIAATAAVALAATAAVALAAPASAGDLFGRRDGGSIKDAPAEAPRRCSFSMNVGGTTDYVFRGISQNLEDPTVQGGVDATCGMFYAGVWGSGVDFIPGSNGTGSGDGYVEVDLYAGIKPTWGPLTFDLGVIYYAYPGGESLLQFDNTLNKLDYVELKLGASGTWNNVTVGGTAFWSPDYFGGSESVITLEGTAAYTFAAMGPVTPTISALIGTSIGDDPAFTFAFGGDYVYWNAGVALAVDKFTFDFRYWGSDNDAPALVGLNDDRFVFSAKVTLP